MKSFGEMVVGQSAAFLMLAILLLAASIGHLALWVGVVNRLHGLGIKRLWIHLWTAVCGVSIAGIPLAVAAIVWWPAGRGSEWDALRIAAWSYVILCALICVAAVVRRVYLQLHAERRGVLLANHTSRFRPIETRQDRLAASGIPALLTRLPWNQALEIVVQEKQLGVPRLPGRHEGLRIAHLSDLHMSGRITKAYFQQVVEHVNRCEPDIVAITGDIIERRKCFDWIADTLGRLIAGAGVYYVLGNHDRHVDERRMHAVLADAGLVHLGGQWRQIKVRDLPLVLAGNELPWFCPAADLRNCPERNADGLPLRVVLAHSPDQFGWAKANDVDLILAGHLHGGQGRLPFVGPILAPSLYGVRYAAGAFRDTDTVMHVSRGTSSLTPVRFNCPPEIAILTLHSDGDR